MKLAQMMNVSRLDERMGLSLLKPSRMRMQVGETSKFARLKWGQELKLTLARLALKVLVT